MSRIFARLIHAIRGLRHCLDPSGSDFLWAVIATNLSILRLATAVVNIGSQCSTRYAIGPSHLQPDKIANELIIASATVTVDGRDGSLSTDILAPDAVDTLPAESLVDNDRPNAGIDGHRRRRWHPSRSDAQRLWLNVFRTARWTDRFVGELPIVTADSTDMRRRMVTWAIHLAASRSRPK